jgi:hypothetical protein
MWLSILSSDVTYFKAAACCYIYIHSIKFYLLAHIIILHGCIRTYIKYVIYKPVYILRYAIKLSERSY